MITITISHFNDLANTEYIPDAGNGQRNSMAATAPAGVLAVTC
jgi:hypothetical protein